MPRTEMEIYQEMQKLQDKKGYVVLACRIPRKVGDVLKVISTSDVGDLNCPTIIIGFSTFEEWRQQTLEVFGNYEVIGAPEDFQYVKVRAE